ncbi:MAG TPA: penicillin-binding transpeptidase domain-containing protein, partial [Candidatus Atribacteria bacterium]|nr:penicillin-binding transpeptidase domain-containing protein [Candidatus Atribacteria bacterium]
MTLKKLLKIIKSRFFIFGVVITLMFSVLGFRLAYLTVEMGEAYYNKAQETKMINVTLRGERGLILDRDGIPLAVNRQSYAVQVDRQWLPAKDEEINEVLRLAVSIIDRNGDKLINNIPIKYGTKVYEDTVPYAVEGLYYDFGTRSLSEHKKRYDKWRKDVRIEVDLPAEEMLKFLRDRYKISEDIPDQVALKIISIRLDLYLNRYRQNEPVMIAEDISASTMAQLETYLDMLPGVQTTTISSRYYPNGTSAQHIIGYVGKITDSNMEAYKSKFGKTLAEAGYNVFSDKYGQDGIEAYAEQWLTGSTKDRHGSLTAEVNALRQVIKVLDEVPPKSGNNVILTIDSRLQRSAENILKEEVTKIREGLPPYSGDRQAPLANSGAIVILDVKTGEILAMASYANSQYPYDLNDFARGITAEEYDRLINDPAKPLYPIAFQGGMEPGSVFKMAVGVAALMEGAVKINETIYDRYRLFNGAPSCWRTTSHGSLNIMDAIKVSCNYYFTTIGYRMGIDPILEWGKKFGLHGPTGLELLQLNGRVDMSYVANPELMKEQETNKARTKIISTLKKDYGLELPKEKLDIVLDFGVNRQYNKLYSYLKDSGLFPDSDAMLDAYYDLVATFDRMERWTAEKDTTRAAMGQSITKVSPLNIARYIAALVNGGKVLETHIVKEIRSPEGEVIKKTEPVVYNQLDIKQEYIDAIKEGM